jgi:hypothetical protein
MLWFHRRPTCACCSGSHRLSPPLLNWSRWDFLLPILSQFLCISSLQKSVSTKNFLPKPYLTFSCCGYGSKEGVEGMTVARESKIWSRFHLFPFIAFRALCVLVTLGGTVRDREFVTLGGWHSSWLGGWCHGDLFVKDYEWPGLLLHGGCEVVVELAVLLGMVFWLLGAYASFYLKCIFDIFWNIKKFERKN